MYLDYSLTSELIFKMKTAKEDFSNKEFGNVRTIYHNITLELYGH